MDASQLALDSLQTLRKVLKIPAYTPEQDGGLMMDDYLDSLKSQAIILSTMDGLSSSVVQYIKALEKTVLDMKYRERERCLEQVSFKVK